MAGYTLPGATLGWPPERSAALEMARRRYAGLDASLARAERALEARTLPEMDWEVLPQSVRNLEELVTGLRGGTTGSTSLPTTDRGPASSADRPPGPRLPAGGSSTGVRNAGSPPVHPPPSVPGAASAAVATGLSAAESLFGALRRMAAPQRLQAPSPVPEVAPGPDRFAEQRRALEGAWRFLVDTLRYVGPRLRIVEAGLVATGLPGTRKTWAEATQAVLAAADGGTLDPAYRGWLPPLVRLFWDGPVAVREAHGALVHWHEAQGLEQRAREALAAIGEALPAGEAAALLAANPVPRLRGVAFPLSHLYVRFAGHAPLDQMFPAPQAAARAPGHGAR